MASFVARQKSIKADVLREALRQLGFTSLWFFLKYIAGFSGPYDRLNTTLHLDMCNFRQSDLCMAPGARFAFFLSRNHRKSTIAGHGANTWELARNGDLKILQVCATDRRGKAFKQIAQRSFDSNELFRWLYPECAPRASSDRWNAEEFVLPSRTRHMVEPSMAAISIMASNAGGHYNYINLDDPIDLDDLDKERLEAGDMAAKINWFKTNSRALLDDWNNDRIGVQGTRYGMEDLYSYMTDDCRVLVGSGEGIIEKPGGTWAIYSRPPIEDGKFIQPETMNMDMFRKMLDDDPWTAQLQYFNNPMDSGSLELKKYKLNLCSLGWNGTDYTIDFQANPNFDDELNESVPLSDCDVVLSTDLAGTEKAVDSKHTRSALVVVARTHHDRDVLLACRAGFWSTPELYDKFEELARKFKDYIRVCLIETNGMQKRLLGIIQEEMMARQLFLSFDESPAKGDKDARIRNIVGLRLARGKLYAVDGEDADLTLEKNLFPRAKYKKDVLDAMEKAISNLTTPDTPEEAKSRFEEEEDFCLARNPVTGY